MRNDKQPQANVAEDSTFASYITHQPPVLLEGESDLGHDAFIAGKDERGKSNAGFWGPSGILPYCGVLKPLFTKLLTLLSGL